MFDIIKKTLQTIYIAPFFLLGTSVFAFDTSKPINVKADKIVFIMSEPSNQDAVYELNDANIFQDNTFIKAEKIILTTTEDNEIKNMLSKGSPCYMYIVITQSLYDSSSSKRFNVGDIIEVQGNEITYFWQENTFTIRGDAYLKTPDAEIKADFIEYNLTQQQLISESSNTQEQIELVLPGNLINNDESDGNEDNSASDSQN